MHRLAGNDAWRLHVHAAHLGRLDRAFAVDRIAEGVDHAAEKALADRGFHDGARALADIALADVPVVAENNDADIVDFEVEGHAARTVGKFDHFTGLNVVEAVNAGDAVTDGEHLADFGDFCFLPKILDLVFENRGDLGGPDIH